MSEQELRDLVCRLAEEGAWRALVHEDHEHRRFAQLLRNDDVDVWVLSWMQFHDTGYHDHDISCGAVAVLEGELVEERLTIGGAPRRVTYRAGDRFTFDPSHVHRMHNETARLAVSIHAYSPPLRALGAYVIDADGTLRRLTQAGDSELTPLAS
jgi:predicted metal-dependent enzyme (double-stranded beta helix superfamily)